MLLVRGRGHSKYMGVSLFLVARYPRWMSMAAGHRVRWIAIWLLIVGWFVALAVNVGGNGAHLLLLAAIALLVYELLIPEETPS